MAQIVIFSDVNGALGFSRYAGPYRIATELRQHGFSVQVIDFFASYSISTLENLLKLHVDTSTLFVGFSATLWTKSVSDKEITDSFTNGNKSLRSIIVDGFVPLFPQEEQFINELFLQIRSRNPKCKIVVGGYKAGNYHRNNKVDYWILGQGENSALALANHLYHNTPLKGVSTEWGVIITDKIYPYSGFNQSQIIWDKSDHLFNNENLPIETARGCVFKCSFCAFNMNGKKFGDYTKEADILRNELIYNFENYGIKEYMISDDTLNDSMQKVEYLYNIISSLPFKIEFSAYARLDVLGTNLEMAPMLQEMGMKSVEFGIETMNKETGKHIGKQGDPDKIINALTELKNIWNDNVYMAAGFILGLPYEDEKSLRKTMEWLYTDNNPLTGIQLNRYWFHIPPTLPKEVGDKDNLESAGFNLTPNGWVYENISKIYSNPEKYGYINLKDGNWKNTHMDTETAKRLEKEFYDDVRAPQKKSMSIFQYYNRMRNIGYQHSEIKNLYYDDKDFVIEAVARRSNAVLEYLRKIS